MHPPRPDQVVAFARTYRDVTQALMAEGVVEEQAREDARFVAMALLYDGDEGSGERCPLCGQAKSSS